MRIINRNFKRRGNVLYLFILNSLAPRVDRYIYIQYRYVVIIIWPETRRFFSFVYVPIYDIITICPRGPIAFSCRVITNNVVYDCIQTLACVYICIRFEPFGKD